MIKDENKAGTPGQGLPTQEGRNDRQGRNHRHCQRLNNNNKAFGSKFQRKNKGD